jgi:hypothetical protein
MSTIVKHNMILLGAAGRRSGKTLLACKLIERYSYRFPIIGVKVTTIHRGNETCPRGGEGCGTCASLQGAYCITEETNRDLNKDTSRLLASGARKVYWLRAKQDYLKEGIESLFRLIPEEEIPLVCESNSLRAFVEPGVFLIIKEKSQRELKTSARKFLQHADRVVTFDPEGMDDNLFNISFDDIKFTHNRWFLNDKAGGTIHDS